MAIKSRILSLYFLTTIFTSTISLRKVDDTQNDFYFETAKSNEIAKNRNGHQNKVTGRADGEMLEMIYFDTDVRKQINKNASNVILMTEFHRLTPILQVKLRI